MLPNKNFNVNEKRINGKFDYIEKVHMLQVIFSTDYKNHPTNIRIRQRHNAYKPKSMPSNKGYKKLVLEETTNWNNGEKLLSKKRIVLIKLRKQPLRCTSMFRYCYTSIPLTLYVEGWKIILMFV